MKKFIFFLTAFMLISFSGCNWKVEIVNPNEPMIESETDINKEPETEIEPEAPFIPDEESEKDSSEQEKSERPALTYTDSENTYSLEVSKPDFGPEVTYIDYINIVNDRLYASSHNSSSGIFSADFNGKNGLVLENSKDDSSYDNIDDICSAGGNDIFILKTDIPEKEPFNLRQTAIKTDSEGNFIEEYFLFEAEDGFLFGSDIVMDKNGNFYLWDYWGKVLVFNDNFSESYIIDHSEEGVFLNVVSLNNGNAYVTTHKGNFLFDHEKQTFSGIIDVPIVTVFDDSGNSEFDFICCDYGNLYGYVFEENRLEKLICLADSGIDSNFLHSADIDENGNITVITKELIRYEPTVFMIFHFEKEN